MSNTPTALTALLAAAALLTAGCGSADEGASRPPPSSTTPPPTTTTAPPVPATLTEMAQHPSEALTDEQIIELFIIPGQSQEGGEQETGFRQCQWQTVQGALLFGPHPDVDMTVDPQVAQLEPGDLDGHRTMLGVDTTRDRCMIYVSVADQQSSFQVAIYPDADQHLGMGGCDILKDLAADILANLS